MYRQCKDDKLKLYPKIYLTDKIVGLIDGFDCRPDSVDWGKKAAEIDNSISYL